MINLNLKLQISLVLGDKPFWIYHGTQGGAFLLGDVMEIPLGLCQCGCGEKTSLSKQNETSRGYVKGQPKKFICGHNTVRTCDVEGCSRKHFGKGYCELHYNRVRRCGSINVGRPCIHGSPEERFWRYVDKGDDNSCWEWNGSKCKDGYGYFRSKTEKRAHRYSYILNFGDIPEGKQVLHKCNNPPCVNPNHLKLGTNYDNMQDKKIAGHYYNGENHHNSKLTDVQVIEVLDLRGPSWKVAEKYGVSGASIRDIRLRRGRFVKLKNQYHGENCEKRKAGNDP